MIPRVVFCTSNTSKFNHSSCYDGLQALFFDIVESGLNDRFKVDDIPRVFKFCQYAKSEIPAPSPKVMKV